jgi:pathogenesis-related protein 1
MKIISTRWVGVAALGFVVGCSAADSGGASTAPFGTAGASGAAGAGGFPGTSGATGVMPMQMGNGPQGGQSGVSVPPTGGTPGAGGVVVGSGGVIGAAGVTGMAGNQGAAGMFGVAGAGGTLGAGGTMSFGGTIGAGGTQVGMGGSSAGTTGIGGMSGGDPEMGRLVGMTAAHNAVRAAVMTTPALQPLVWSDKLAQYAQQWADNLAMTSCSSPHHRSQQDLQSVGYGENLAAFTSSFGMSTAQQAVDGWGGEKSCYTFGTFMVTDKCDTTCYTNMHSDGCGHYTQIVWRKSTQVGCGVATCKAGFGNEDIWICNYAPAGNYVGQNPY